MFQRTRRVNLFITAGGYYSTVIAMKNRLRIQRN